MFQSPPGAACRALLTGSALLALTLIPGAVAAQSPAGMDGTRAMYEMVRGHIMTTATESSEDLYAYRPTDEVRSLGELLGHVGNASFMFCSTALGETSPATSNLEEAGSKAEVVAGLEAAFAYCDRAYSELSADQLAEEVSLFGMTGDRMWILVFNAAHDWEHYGNLVTYMRLNGIVPPSSRGGM